MSEIIQGWTAIAAMSLNRVIGSGGKIPWHLPEDFQWFKQCTLGNIIVLGRKTFEAMGRILPGRHTIIVTRHPGELKAQHPLLLGGVDEPGTASIAHGDGTSRPGAKAPAPAGAQVRLVTSLEFVANHHPDSVFICGGAQIYEQALPRCGQLLLTRVKRHVEGDAFFPPFEHLFEWDSVVRDTLEFTIERWRRR